jgi:hypothetical protein
MQKFTSFIIASIIAISLFGQAPGKINIKGILTDTLGVPIPYATVMLLSPKDSTLQNFTSTGDNGDFKFNNVKNNSYLFKISHMTYIPFQKYIGVSKSENVDLGNIKLKEINQTLMEVVIKAAKAPLFIKGDTIEYDATTFKVAPGSTVEDLLRRLPGIEVDASGNISTQGKDVKKVYVDGKTFFGDDPKSATKNLGAETISKVQVFDEKSEQTKLTGIDDGTKEKAMNLELKDEYKNGKFGKISAAAGTEGRWASNGNFNRFNKKTQLSFIGYANNVNQTGVNWEDYSEFQGNNAFNNFDNGDFGFNSRRRMFLFSFDDSPVSNYDGRGFTENFGGGTNFNYDNNGKKFNASYFYNQTDLDYVQTTLRQTFIDNSNYSNSNDTLTNSNFRASHTIGSRFEREFNPNNKLIVKGNFKFSGYDNLKVKEQTITNFSLIPYNHVTLNNESDQNSFKITSAGIYRHLFSKKGRSIAGSAGYNLSISDGTEDLNTLNKFFEATTPTDQIRNLINSDKNAQEYKSSLLYTEPLNEKLFAEIFYNFSNVDNFSNRQALAPFNNNNRIDSLSTYYEQNTLYNRLGSVLRYANNGFNAAIGIAAQSLVLTGNYALDKGLEWSTIQDPKSYINFTPNIQINYDLGRQMHAEISYVNQINAPDFNDLYPIKNTTDPTYQVIGNPDLITEKSHETELEFHYWNPASFANFNLSTSYNITKDPIVYNQTTTFDIDKGVYTVSIPENMDQKNTFRTWIWANIPIVKTKLSLQLNGGYTYSNSPVRINLVKDEIDSKNYNLGSNLNLTLGTKLTLTGGLSGNISDINYITNQIHNQDYYNYSIKSSVKWQFEKNTYLESSFNYNVYKNDLFGLDQKLPIWNASVRHILGKKKRFEIRLSAYDILNKSVTINQYATRNFIEKSETNTLTQYVLLGLTYNIKGFDAKPQRGGRGMMIMR